MTTVQHFWYAPRISGFYLLQYRYGSIRLWGAQLLFEQPVCAIFQTITPNHRELLANITLWKSIKFEICEIHWVFFTQGVQILNLRRDPSCQKRLTKHGYSDQQDQYRVWACAAPNCTFCSCVVQFWKGLLLFQGVDRCRRFSTEKIRLFILCSGYCQKI